MSSDGSSDMAANAWPGFVDILSAVVIMFVFFVLITAAALYFYTLTYKSKAEIQGVESLEIGAANDSNVVAKLEQQNEQLRKEIEAAKEALSQDGGSSDVETPNETQAAQSFGEQSADQSLVTSDDETSLVLFHDPGAITVNDESAEKIAAFIEKMTNKYGADNIEIVLTSPKLANAATQTRAKRVAVARMLNVRNTLLNSTINRENIDLKVVESELVDESSDWTRFQINVLK